MPRKNTNNMGHGLEVGFCDSDGRGFSTKQPADQLERWSLPRDNGTHLVIPWHPHQKACGRNVTSYEVDVTTSASFLNFFVNAFGSFPQDMCDPKGSKAREATSATAPTCSLYEKNCEKNERIATFIVPRALRKLTVLDVEVTVIARGTLAPLNKSMEKGDRIIHWCHKYRKAQQFEQLSPWRNKALPEDSNGLIQRAYIEHHRRMTSLEPGFLVLSIAVYCLSKRRRRKSVLVDLAKLALGVAAPCLFVLLARSAPVADLALGAPEPALLVAALLGQLFVVKNRWPFLVNAVAASNKAIQREREAKDRVANTSVVRSKSERIVVETLKPRLDEDSDTSTDDDDENLNALDDWLATPDQEPAPAELKIEPVAVSPYALVAYNALAVWRWFFVLCWCQPAAARAVAPFAGEAAGSVVGVLMAVVVMACAERTAKQERLLDLAALAGLCCACQGTALAACPLAFAVDYSAVNVEAASWRDVARRLVCALLVVAVIGSVFV